MADSIIRFDVKMVGKVDLDSAGISSILTGAPVANMVSGVAQKVAAGARMMIPNSQRRSDPQGEVVVQTYTAHGGRLLGNRAAASVIVAYAQGVGLQARYGVLTRPVAALGLAVSGRKGLG